MRGMIGAVLLVVSILFTAYPVLSASFEDTLAQYRAQYASHPFGFKGLIQPITEPVLLRYGQAKHRSISMSVTSNVKMADDEVQGVGSSAMRAELSSLLKGDTVEWRIGGIKMLGGSEQAANKTGFSEEMLIQLKNATAKIITTRKGKFIDAMAELKNSDGSLRKPVKEMTLEQKQLWGGVFLTWIAGQFSLLPDAPIKTNDIFARFNIPGIVAKNFGGGGFNKRIVKDLETEFPNMSDIQLTVVGKSKFNQRETVVSKLDVQFNHGEGEEQGQMSLTGFVATDIRNGVTLEALVRMETSVVLKGEHAMGGDQYIHWQTQF